MSDRRGLPLIVGAGVAIGVTIWAVARSTSRPSAERIDGLLTARFGSLGAGLRWSDVVDGSVVRRLGIDNMPVAMDAANLKRLCTDTLYALPYYSGTPWTVVEGYRSPALARHVGPNACHLPGHDDGTGLCVRAEGIPDEELPALFRQYGVSWDRMVLRDGAVHIEARGGRDRRLTAVELLNGQVVRAEGL